MRENQRGTATKKKKNKKMKTDAPPYLPQEIVLENILTRLPSKTLIKWGCICKLWYNSIHHDPHFASSHFLQSQKNPCLIFHFLNVERRRQRSFSNYLFWSEDKKEDDAFKLLHRDKKLAYICGKKELIGYCNGLGCLLNNREDVSPGDIEIINPTLFERIWISGSMLHGCVNCCGFGFDSLTNEYKVVLITYTDEKAEFKCLVFTLGTNSWRETTNPPSPYAMWMTAAIFCGGALFWRSIIEPEEILLSFDLHDETFQVIQLPADCVSTTLDQRKGIHLLESKGSLCVAHLDDDQNCGSCKVQLHFLKDKVKQVWIEETFDIPSFSSLPFCRDISSIRLVSFSDRVFLYWFDKRGVNLYDLHMKHFKVVKPAPFDRYLFAKKKPSDMDMDYQVSGCHSVTLVVVGTTMVIFDGEDANRSLLDDLHILDLETMMPWECVLLQAMIMLLHCMQSDTFSSSVEMERSRSMQQSSIPTPHAGHAV